MIEALAKMRLADEYDAAQERGDVQKKGGEPKGASRTSVPTAADLGVTNKEISEARSLRNAEAEDPGRVSRIIGETIDADKEPTRRAFQPPPKKKRAPDSTKESLQLIGLFERVTVKAQGKFFDYLRNLGVTL